MIQRSTQALIPTVREVPTEATNASHILLLRAGFIRQVGAGLYNFLPLGLRVLRKVESIVRAEMNAAGALEVLMPAMLPADYFKETGRWDVYGDVLVRFKDRKGGEYHLGPTHEEIVTDMVRREVHSYRQLPLNLYQIQTKFRDEPRPRSGILRSREFIMKDAYSFDINEEGAVCSYEIMRDTYTRIFKKLGLTFRIVQADSGAIGGKTSAEFQILADSGEDAIVACTNCEYAANIEVAEVIAKTEEQTQRLRTTLTSLSKIHTPKVGSIAEVSTFLKVQPNQCIKSLLYVTPDRTIVMVCVRGDHEVNEIKLARILGVTEVYLAPETDVERATHASVGFAGPIGFSGKILVDRAVTQLVDAVAGANQTDYHYTGINWSRGDFNGEVVDLRSASDGDLCPQCGPTQLGTLKSYRGIEGGHIFILGTHYSSKMQACFSDETGAQRPMIMGCYGIGISRLVAAAVEQNHDADGISWPVSIAPYHVHLCTLGKEDALINAAQKLAQQLEALGIDVLWDDRDERPGVKFKDADLIGLPIRVTIGAKTLAQGTCEFKPRTLRDAKAFEAIPLENAAQYIANWIQKN